MWFIQRYMQFGFAAFDAIIHVSDQPVVPSFGLTTSTGSLSAARTCTWSGHTVPTTLSLFLNDWTCFA